MINLSKGPGSHFETDNIVIIINKFLWCMCSSFIDVYADERFSLIIHFMLGDCITYKYLFYTLNIYDDFIIISSIFSIRFHWVSLHIISSKLYNYQDNLCKHTFISWLCTYNNVIARPHACLYTVENKLRTLNFTNI